MKPTWERQPIADGNISVVLLMDQAEVPTLEKTLAAWHAALVARSGVFEILIPCTTAQAAELESLTQRFKQVRLIADDEIRSGPGSCFKAGAAAAQYPLLLSLPVGFSADCLKPLLQDIDLADIVCGVRKSKVPGWKRRQFFSKAYQLFGILLQDPESGLKLYRREIFERLPIQSRGSFAQIEILAKANFQNRLITEVVVEDPADGSNHTQPPVQVRSDFWRVLQNPNFGPPPEKVEEEAIKPMFTKNLPSAPVTPDQKLE